MRFGWNANVGFGFRILGRSRQQQRVGVLFLLLVVLAGGGHSRISASLLLRANSEREGFKFLAEKEKNA